MSRKMTIFGRSSLSILIGFLRNNIQKFVQNFKVIDAISFETQNVDDFKISEFFFEITEIIIFSKSFEIIFHLAILKSTVNATKFH